MSPTTRFIPCLPSWACPAMPRASRCFCKRTGLWPAMWLCPMRHFGRLLRRVFCAKPWSRTTTGRSRWTSYNGLVHKNSVIAGIRQGVVIVLMALLALAPFLHGHLGASHVSGFHVDGMDLGHNIQAGSSQTVWTAHQASEEESPALGVSVSLPLPKAGDEAQLVLALLVTCLCAWLALATLARRARRPSPAPCVVPRSYAWGWPPPALAPPL